jgi:hypothetical protein
LKPKCDEPLSSFAFKCKLRRYNEVNARMGDSMDVEVGHTMVDLEGRFLMVRAATFNPKP